MAERQKILIIDDDENCADMISQYLKKECFETRVVADGRRAIEEFKEFRPHLIILDLILPGTDGYQICRDIRRISQTPIIIVSAKTEVFDRVLGLELGADDYMTKPFDCKELAARIRAVLRRTSAPPVQPEEADTKAPNKVTSVPDLVINLTNYSVTYRGENVDMPPKEIELLYFLASSPNQVFTREQLLQAIWGYDYAGDTRTVDVHVKRLREKLSDNPNWSITTVWGVGYKFNLL